MGVVVVVVWTAVGLSAVWIVLCFRPVLGFLFLVLRVLCVVQDSASSFSRVSAAGRWREWTECERGRSV